MAYVNTLLGTIDPEEMGITAIHEHIMWGLPGWEYDPGYWFDIGYAFEKCYHDLIDFRLVGGGTYVDCSGISLGRHLAIYTKLAKSTGLNIVASTGFWADYGIAPHFRTKDIDYFEDLFIRELTQGMGHTLVKAGIIKVGNGEETFTELEEIEYRAAARAAKRTGAAVITEGVHFALKQLEILLSEKVDPSRIIIAHLDSEGYMDLERDKQIAHAGAYVSYDQAGIENTWSRTRYAMPDERRVELVSAMLEAGFQDRILLSSSSKCWGLGRGEAHRHMIGHVLRYFVPKLKQAGVSEAAINAMLLENPKHVLPIQ
ncbi:phosphotriesterase [Chloroflexota bacterium]